MKKYKVRWRGSKNASRLGLASGFLFELKKSKRVSSNVKEKLCYICAFKRLLGLQTDGHLRASQEAEILRCKTNDCVVPFSGTDSCMRCGFRC